MSRVVDRTVTLNIQPAEESTRPAGVIGTLLFYHVGTTAPAGINGWTLVANTGRSSVQVPMSAEYAPGTQVWFTGMYYNSRKDSGPLADPVNAFLGGGVSKVA